MERADAPGAMTVFRGNVPGASAAFLEKKAKSEIEDQLQQLQAECVIKDEEIARLKELNSQGKLQKHLHQTLEENRDLRKELERLYEQQISVEEITARLTAQEALTESVQKEFVEYREQTRMGLEQLRQDREEADKQLIVYQQRAETVKHDEEKTVILNDELQQKAIQYETQLQAQAGLIARLKDGTRLEELETAIKTFSDLLSQKEQDRQDLERALQEAKAETDVLRQHTEDFEDKIKATLSDTVASLTEQLHQYKELVETRERELSSERARYALLEDRVLSADRRILEMGERIRLYESGYCLDDALREQRDLNSEFSNLKKEMTSMAETLNARERLLERIAEENKVLRVKAGVDISWGIKEAELQLQNRIEIEKMASLAEHYRSRIDKLETERVELLEELRQKAIQKGENGVVFFGLSAEKMELVEKFVESVRNGEEFCFDRDVAQRHKEELDRALLAVSDMKAKYDAAMSTCNELRKAITIGHSEANDKKIDQIMELISRLRPENLEQNALRESSIENSAQDLIGEQQVSASHLVACLEELAQSEELVKMSRSKIASYETAVTTLSDRLNSLFLLHSETCENFKTEKEQMQQVIDKLSSQLTNLMQTIENRPAELSPNDDFSPEVARRRIAVLQSNEILLTRRLNILEQSLLSLETRESQGREDRIELERVLKARIVQLDHSLASSTARMTTLESQLGNSVHRALYENLQSELSSIQSKFADLMVEHSVLQQQCLKIKDMQILLDERSRETLEANSKAESFAMQIEVLQSKLDEMPCEDDKKMQLMAQVAALEIREGNAQRALSRAQSQLAENATRYARLSEDLGALEDKHQSLLHLYHSEKDITSQLRKTLSAQTVQHEASIAELQSQLFKATSNARRSKKLFQIAKKQALQLSSSKQDFQEQISGLKHTIVQLQMNSDEHVALGQVHHELINARLEIRSHRRTLEESHEKLHSLETEVLRQSKLLDDNAATYFLENQALRKRVDFLQQCLADINITSNCQLSGEQALSLHESNKLLSIRLADARAEIVKADDRRRQAEESLGQITVENTLRNEIQSFVEDLCLDNFEEKFQLQILEWTKQLKQLRLSKLQLEHQTSFLSNRNSFNEKLLKECQNELQRLQVSLSEKESKLVAQAVRIKQQEAMLLETSRRKTPKLQSDGGDLELPSALDENHNKMEQIRQEARNLQSIIDSKDQIIELQRQQLNKLESRIRTEAEADAAAAALATEDAELCKDKILKTAEITIQSLRVLLAQKDASLAKYRDILGKAFKKYHSEKELDAQTIEQLKEQIANEKIEQSSKLHNALSKIEDVQQIPLSLISLKQHEELMFLKQKTIDELSAELSSIQSLLAETRTRSRDLETEISQLRENAAAFESEVTSLREHDSELFDLRQTLSEKAGKQEHLEGVILELKQQLVTSQQQQSSPRPTTPSKDPDLKKVVSGLKATVKKLGIQKHDMQEKLRELEDQQQSTIQDLQRSRKALESAQTEITSLHNNLNAAKKKLKQNRDKHAALSEKLKSMTADLEQLQEAQVKAESSQKPLSQIVTQTSIERHQGKVNVALKTSRACSPVCFPETDVNPAEEVSSTNQKDAFEQWELRKKLEKRVDVLKTRLKEKSSSIQQLETCITDLKTKMQRLENDNRQLIETLRSAEHQGKSSKDKTTSISNEQLDSLETLRDQLFRSQEEVVNLKRRLEVQAANRISQLEFELKNMSALVKDKPRSAPEKSKLKLELDDLSQKNLTLSCENLDLRFEKEHSSVIIQRLRKRIAQLEQLVTKGAKISSNPKDTISENELTVTIDSMAKIIDSLKQENETLRLNSHSNLKYTEAVRSLNKAKKDWCNEVEALKAELRSKAEEVSSLSRAESAAKLNCRSLRKDLAKVRKELAAKESEANHLAQSVFELESQIENLRQTIKDLQSAAQQQDSQSVVRVSTNYNDAHFIDLRSKYADLLAENEALKTELSAFDVSFFEEIEDLKFQYAETSKRLAQYRAEFGELPVH